VYLNNRVKIKIKNNIRKCTLIIELSLSFNVRRIPDVYLSLRVIIPGCVFELSFSVRIPDVYLNNRVKYKFKLNNTRKCTLIMELSISLS
jgi:hypothetical protein